MVTIWVIVGDRNSGKSSTTRALTGVSGDRKAWRVAIQGRDRTAYVQTNSLQEHGISAQKFVKSVEMARANFVIATIQARIRKNFAYEHLVYFQKIAGWKIAGVAILGRISETEEIGLTSIKWPLKFLEDVVTVPTNKIAAGLRRAWQFD